MRLATGILAGAAALKAMGWRRATLGALATAGLGTALMRYCAVNQAMGRDSSRARETRLLSHAVTAGYSRA